MSRETYDEHLSAPGTAVSLADVGRFDWHRRICPVCSVSQYAYTRCAEGSRLAKRVVQPAISTPRQTNQEITNDMRDAELAQLYVDHESGRFA